MMKRVCNSRFAVCAMLLAVFLLVGGAVAPVCAREDMSAGQAGDPGDGFGIADTGGSSQPSAGGTGNVISTPQPATQSVVLLPVLWNGVLTFQVLVIFFREVMRK